MNSEWNTEITDAQVEDAILKSRAGLPSEFAMVVRRYEMPLRAWLAGHAPPGVDADEIAQRTFIAAYTRLDDYTPGTRFEAWLFTIARFQLKTELTRLRRVAGYHARYAPDLLQRELDRRSNEPSEVFVSQVQCLRECVQSLGDHLRRFVVWRYDEEIPPGPCEDDDCALQIPALGRLHRHIAENGDRKDTALPVATGLVAAKVHPPMGCADETKTTTPQPSELGKKVIEDPET